MSKDTIRRLKAHTDVYGFSETIAGYSNLGYDNQYAAWLNACQRTGYTNNPVRILGGASYRNPSNYSRTVRKYDRVSSSKTNRVPPWSMPLHNSQPGRDLATNFPSYWNQLTSNLDSNIQNEAIVKALNKLASRKASLGVSFGESLKASSMLSSYVIKLLTAVLAAKKGNWRKVERIFHLDGTKKVSLDGLYPANKWLEYQYGWKPLLSDIYKQYGIIKDGLTKDEFLIFGQGSGRRTSKLNDELYYSVARIYYKREFVGEQICITKLIARLTSQSWRNAGKVGLLNPLEVAWELVPFSFIVDWFMPVGNVLEALTARAGLEYISGTSTFITGGSCTAKAVRTTGNVLFQAGGLRMQYFSLDRKVHYTMPLARFYVDESPFSTARSLNALALWRSITGGGVPRHIRS